MAKQETITDLTNDLVGVKNQLLDGSIEMETAKEFNNTAGKILNTIKVQLAHQALVLACENHGRTPFAIPYLENQKCLPKT